MRDNHRSWRETGVEFGWHMPSASLIKRLPIIRHFRAMWVAERVRRHDEFWQATTGAAPTGYDQWVIYGIYHGLEAKP